MIVGNALIGLREGLEAGLIVTILIAFLVRSGRRDALRVVYAAVVAALIVSVLAGVVLTITAAGLSGQGKEIFQAVTSLVAAAFITGMVFWMRHAATSLTTQLEGKLAAALAMGPLAVFIMSFVAVLREGLEAAIFLLAGSQSPGRTMASFAIGVGIAVALSCLIYFGMVKLSFEKAFTVIGFLLILVAAGIFAHGVRDLQQAGVLWGASVHAWDLRGLLPLETWHGSLVNGIFNVSAEPTVLEALAWLGYLAVVIPLAVRAWVTARAKVLEAA